MAGNVRELKWKLGFSADTSSLEGALKKVTKSV